MTCAFLSKGNGQQDLILTRPKRTRAKSIRLVLMLYVKQIHE